MRKSFLIFLLLLVLVIAAIIFWQRSKRLPIIVATSEVVQATNTNLSVNHPGVIYQTTNIPMSVSQTGSNSPIAEEARRQEVYSNFVKEHNAPINFYGQFLDQYSNVIPGVSIRVSIRHLTIPDPLVPQVSSKEIYLEKTSDPAGRFEFRGETGDAIYVESIQKNGYELASAFSHNFGPSSGSIEKPVIIRMWKEGESQKLISYHTLFGFQPDGRVYTLDLVNDKKLEGESADGDLLIKFDRPPIRPNEPYSWTLQISAVAGGLIGTTDEFTYFAPQSGYQPQVLLKATSVAPSAVPDFTKDYYIATRNGQIYGVVHMQIYSDYRGQSAILVDSRINPSGSRNLQP